MKKKTVGILVFIFLLSVVYPVILSYMLIGGNGWDGKKRKSSSQEVKKRGGKR